MSDLITLAARLRSHSGILSKVSIQKVARLLGNTNRSAWIAPGDGILNGDDAAAIPDGDGYLLMAGEGIVPELVRRDPWFAGFCSIMVNVNDIAAMGGVPYAVTSVLFASDAVDNERVLAGMIAASRAFGVPVVGGHTGHSARHLALRVNRRTSAAFVVEFCRQTRTRVGLRRRSAGCLPRRVQPLQRRDECYQPRASTVCRAVVTGRGAWRLRWRRKTFPRQGWLEQ